VKKWTWRIPLSDRIHGFTGTLSNSHQYTAAQRNANRGKSKADPDGWSIEIAFARHLPSEVEDRNQGWPMSKAVFDDVPHVALDSLFVATGKTQPYFRMRV
jgi:hypothetical protein